MVDYLRYYDLETYLFEDVHRRFHAAGSLSAFDFFSIIIWKANRAKSNVARRLLARAPNKTADLDEIVAGLTRSLFEAPSHRPRRRPPALRSCPVCYQDGRQTPCCEPGELAG